MDDADAADTSVQAHRTSLYLGFPNLWFHEMFLPAA